MVRRCTKTTAHFGNGVSGTLIQYFVIDPDAKFLTDFVPLSKFGSASWIEDYDDGSPLGEVIGADRTFTDGTLEEYPCCGVPTGDLNGFVSGIDPTKPPLDFDDSGIPINCKDDAAFSYGFDLGYTS